MQSIQELVAKFAAAEAAGKRPDLEEHHSLTGGEEVIGIVSDPGLLAMVAVLDDQYAECVFRWPTPPENDPEEMKAALAAGLELTAVRAVVKYEIRRILGLNSADVPSIALRRAGGELVVVNVKERRQRVLMSVSNSDSLSILGLLGALGSPRGRDGRASADSGICDVCDERACPLHPLNGRVAQA